MRGAMITAVDLLRGLAALIGWKRIEVPGATGYSTPTTPPRAGTRSRRSTTRPHLRARRSARRGVARRRLRRQGQGARRDRPAHRRPAAEALAAQGDYRILVSPDHPTSLRTKTHSHGIVPFAMAGTGIAADEFTAYDDTTAAKSKLAFDEGWQAMKWFIKSGNH